MAVLEDGDFELQGVLLKGTPDYPIYVQEFDPGKTEHQDEDVLNPLDGTLMMGRDRVVPPKWEFKLGMGDFTKGPALRSLGELMRVWQVPQTEPGVVFPLKYKLDGRVRQVFGRPRPFSFNPEMLVNVGYVVAVAGFHLQDAQYYDIVRQSVQLRMLAQPVGSGFTAPFLVPIMTDAGQGRAGFAVNNGSAPAPFTLRINGPVGNPKVSGPGWFLHLNRSIAEKDWVEVDTRAFTVRTRGGADIPGSLTRSSRLLSARLKPGRNEIIFEGVDPTGISNINLSWFDAYYEH